MERDNIDIRQAMVWVVLITSSFISFVMSFSHGDVTLWCIKGKMNDTVVTAHVFTDWCHTWVDFTVGSLFCTVQRISGLWRFFWWKIQDFLEPFPKQTFLFQTQDYNLKQSVEASSSHDAMQTYSNIVTCGYKGVLKLLIL